MITFSDRKGRLALVAVGVGILPLLIWLASLLQPPALIVIHWLALMAHTRPETAELGIIALRYAHIILGEATLLLPSMLIMGTLSITKTDTSRKGLVMCGFKWGIPYGVGLYFLYWWIHEPNYLIYRGFTGHTSPLGIPLLTWILVFAALCEEVYFRGALYPLARSVMPRPWAVVISVGAFVLWHPQLYVNLHIAKLLGLVSGGLLYTYLRERTGSVIPPACAHICFNVIQILIANL